MDYAINHRNSEYMYHITWSCFFGSFAGNIFKHILIENVYVSLNLNEVDSPWSIEQ